MGRELRGRSIETTAHHLVPKNRKESPTAQPCKPCHQQVHASFTHAELKREYDTTEALRNADRLQPFARWIRTTNETDVRWTRPSTSGAGNDSFAFRRPRWRRYRAS